MDVDPSVSSSTNYLLIGGIVITVIGTILLYSGVFWGIHSSNENDNPGSKKITLSSVSFEDSVLTQGQNLYEQYCVTCHGRNGRGQGPAAPVMTPRPTNFQSEEAQKLTADYMFKVISEGQQERGMPAWSGRLSKSERWAIISYIKKEWSNLTKPSKSHED